MNSPYDPVARLHELGFPALAGAVRGNNECTIQTATATYVVYFGAAALNVTAADDGTPRIAIGDPMSPKILLRPTEILRVIPGAVQSPSLPGVSWERRNPTEQR